MKERKTEILTARLTPADKEKIRSRAGRAHMTVTDYVTACALGKEIVRVEGLGPVLTELKAQGRNLNRLTTLANLGRIQIVRADDLIDCYAELCRSLSELSREVT